MKKKIIFLSIAIIIILSIYISSTITKFSDSYYFESFLNQDDYVDIYIENQDQKFRSNMFKDAESIFTNKFENKYFLEYKSASNRIHEEFKKIQSNIDDRSIVTISWGSISDTFRITLFKYFMDKEFDNGFHLYNSFIKPYTYDVEDHATFRNMFNNNDDIEKIRKEVVKLYIRKFIFNYNISLGMLELYHEGQNPEIDTDYLTWDLNTIKTYDIELYPYITKYFSKEDADSLRLLNQKFIRVAEDKDYNSSIKTYNELANYIESLQ